MATVLYPYSSLYVRRPAGDERLNLDCRASAKHLWVVSPRAHKLLPQSLASGLITILGIITLL